jgi:hypothetical protein
MKEVDGVIISSIHRITGNEYFKQLFLRQSQNCFSARSAKVPSTQKTRLWDFLPVTTPRKSKNLLKRQLNYGVIKND